MQKTKTVGLIAHDARKGDLLDWVRLNAVRLAKHSMVCTGTTGGLITDMFKAEFPALDVNIEILKSGPLGGDQQMGALIADGRIDVLVFFTDPMTTQPHDVDVKALMRICVVYDTALACTRSTADFVISSPFFDSQYSPVVRDYTTYIKRETFKI